jgi:Na+/H+-dicarboxylate symporter
VTSAQILKNVALKNIGAIAIGIVLGLLLSRPPEWLGLLSWIPVTIIKTLATPLLFFAVLQGFISQQFNAQGLKKLLKVCSLNAICAVTLAVSLVNLFQPGKWIAPLVAPILSHKDLDLSLQKSTHWMDAVKAIVPQSIVEPFVQNNVPAILFLAILLGMAIQKISKRSQHHTNPASTLHTNLAHVLDVVTTMLHYALNLMPIAICASVAKAVATQGVDVLASLLPYVAACIGGMTLHILFVYHFWIIRVAKVNVAAFWKAAKVPVIYAFGVNSSLAALPSTLHALDELNCPSGASKLGACVGTNLNNDGILLYEVAALLMLGQAAGLDWSIGQQISLALICVLATLGVAGYPEAGVIALSMVLSSAHLPQELLPLLLPVDWLVARFRSATNVVSDMTVSLVIGSSMKNFEMTSKKI